MDITFISRKLDLRGGGSNFSLHAIATQLSERGHNIKVITAKSEDNWLPDDPVYNVVDRSVISGNKISDSKSIYNLFTTYEAESDIFHIFNPRFALIGGWYRYQGGDVPTIGRLNTYSFCTNHSKMDGECHRKCGITEKFAHDKSNMYGKMASLPIYSVQTHMEPKLLNKLDQLFAISPSIKDIYHANGVDESNISVVPNFYDPGFGEQEPTNNKSKEEFSLLYVGRLEEFKGIDILLKGLSEMPDEIHVDIIGDGDDSNRFKEYSDELGVNDLVTFHGWVDHADLPYYYQNADLFVHPGKWPEPFGRTLLEAMQYRTPMVVSNIGAPPWVVGQAGETFERNDHEDLAQVVTLLMTDSEDLERRKEACLNRLQDFHPSTVIDEIENQYQDVMQ